MKVCMHGVQKIQLLNLFIILAIICLEPPTPENGDVILSSQVISVDTILLPILVILVTFLLARQPGLVMMLEER